MKYNAFCSTEIEFVTDAQFQKSCLELQYQNLVLVLSESACNRYHLEEFVENLKTKYRLLWIKQSVSYPTQRTLREGLDLLGDFQTEAILAIGGGSAIDFAKGLKAFCDPKQKMTEDAITKLLKTKKISENEIDLIAVPTTAGTGAEVTKWATIWDDAKECKYSIDHEILKPDKAYIVPEFAAKADAKLTITTGLDSIAHAVEAYWSKKTSPLVRALSRESIGLSVQYLREILANPQDVSLREKQCLASVLSGLAFSMTRTTACHSISYPLTMEYHIPHGTAVAMTLAQVAKLNRGSFPEEEALLTLFAKQGGIRAFLQSVCGTEVSLRLRDYNISADAIYDIAKDSFTLGRMDNNPVALNTDTVTEILKETF